MNADATYKATLSFIRKAEVFTKLSNNMAILSKYHKALLKIMGNYLLNNMYVYICDWIWENRQIVTFCILRNTVVKH